MDTGKKIAKHFYQKGQIGSCSVTKKKVFNDGFLIANRYIRRYCTSATPDHHQSHLIYTNDQQTSRVPTIAKTRASIWRSAYILYYNVSYSKNSSINTKTLYFNLTCCLHVVYIALRVYDVIRLLQLWSFECNAAWSSTHLCIEGVYK